MGINSKLEKKQKTVSLCVFSFVVCMIGVVGTLMGTIIGHYGLPRIINKVHTFLQFDAESSPMPICSAPEVLGTLEQLPLTFRSITDVQQFINRKPTSADLEQNPDDDQQYLQQVLAWIFPEGYENLSAEQQSLDILRFTSSYLRLKDNAGSATKIIKEGYAICGGRITVYSALSRKIGLPTRTVNIFGLVGQGGHSLVEVFWDKSWHLLDPSFGVFFYSEADYSERGKILSIRELLSLHTDDYTMFKVLDEPLTGLFNEDIRRFGITLADDEYLFEVYGWSLFDSYKNYFNTSFPIQYDYGEQIVAFPFEVDLREDNIISLGEVDNDYSDMVKLTATEGTAGNIGSYYFQSHNLHPIFIKAPSPGYVRITYISSKNEPSYLGLFPLKDILLINSSQSDRKVEFILKLIEDTEGAVIVFSEKGGWFWIDAVEAEWLGETIDLEVYE